jgi:hypothetical protein
LALIAPGSPNRLSFWPRRLPARRVAGQRIEEDEGGAARRRRPVLEIEAIVRSQRMNRHGI